MDTVFKSYDKLIKKRPKLLDQYDPSLVEYRGIASSRLPDLFKNIRGQHICISLMLDKECCIKKSNADSATECQLPTVADFKQTVLSFKQSLAVT